MNKTKLLTNTITGVLIAYAFSATPCAYADKPRSAVALFTQKDYAFSETITLYSDGKYQQAETHREGTPWEVKHPSGSIFHRIFFPEPSLPVHLTEPKRGGTWRVLDKEGGTPIALKAGSGLPLNAVVELKGAMPFGVTWENRSPYSSRDDRTLPTASFQVPQAAVKAQ